jgi:predicted ribosomally synthesized peptide with nif11-like leader
MNFSSAQLFVRKMKEDKQFREHFQNVTENKALWKDIRKEGYNFDEKDLVRAMAECMNELEPCGSSMA